MGLDFKLFEVGFGAGFVQGALAEDEPDFPAGEAGEIDLLFTPARFRLLGVAKLRFPDHRVPDEQVQLERLAGMAADLQFELRFFVI